MPAPARHDDAPESAATPAQQPPLNLSAGEAWPYPWRTYVGRFLWSIVWCTVWQVCWARIPILRTIILRLFGARVAGSAWVSASVRVKMPWALSIGKGCTIGPRTHIYNLGGVTIGDQVVISQDVYVCGGTHDYTDPTYPLVRKKIAIENYVWIAAGAFISPGVTVGEGAVVGARAVVTKDVEPWTVVAGNPARVIKRRVVRNTGEAGTSQGDVHPPPGTGS